jgi:DNA/RNA-binding domain of Phe-tRNA-synthetase-like protein
MEIRIELPAVKLGIVEGDGLHVEPAGADLTRVVDETCTRKREEFTVASLAEAEPVRAVRSMFREWGMDPSKYRPSSEALLRRVVQEKGLFFISNVVDIVNLGSIETGWPYGCYDGAKLHPPVVFRHGAQGESYERVGKEMWHLEGRPVLSDAVGAFGSPISDSTRTMITESAQSALIVIYAPIATADDDLSEAMQRVSDRLSRFARASVIRSDICK